MKEVVKKEILKWLDAKVISSISNNKWVSPMQCDPKKGGIIVLTGRTLIDIHKGEIAMRMSGEEVIFNVFKALSIVHANSPLGDSSSGD